MTAPATSPPRPQPLLVGIGEILWDLLPGGRQLGGAPTNVAWHAVQLGLRSTVVSAVGDDEPGQELLVRLDAMGIDRSYVGVDFNHPTGSAGVTLDAAGNSRFTITEGVAWDHVPLHVGLLHLSAGAAAICVGTLAQRNEVTRRTIQSVLKATEPGCLRVYDVNLRQSFFNAAIVGLTLACADVVKLNDEEWPVVAHMLDLPEDPRPGAMALRRRHGLRVVAVTRGANGSLLCDERGLHELPGTPCLVVDTVGAGDAFTATLAAGLVRGLALDRIHALAAQAAAHVCTCAGATPTLPEAVTTPFRAHDATVTNQWGGPAR